MRLFLNECQVFLNKKFHFCCKLALRECKSVSYLFDIFVTSYSVYQLDLRVNQNVASFGFSRTSVHFNALKLPECIFRFGFQLQHQLKTAGFQIQKEGYGEISEALVSAKERNTTHFCTNTTTVDGK